MSYPCVQMEDRITLARECVLKQDLTSCWLWVACLRQDHQANAKYAFVAQLAEHFTRNEGVMGSSPIKSFLKILV